MSSSTQPRFLDHRFNVLNLITNPGSDRRENINLSKYGKWLNTGRYGIWLVSEEALGPNTQIIDFHTMQSQARDHSRAAPRARRSHTRAVTQFYYFTTHGALRGSFGNKFCSRASEYLP
jgi:hypothetical protein